MHCRSCELLIEDGLNNIGQVCEVKVNYKTGLAEIAYEADSKPSEKEIARVVKEAGYEIGSSKQFLGLLKIKMFIIIYFLVLHFY